MNAYERLQAVSQLPDAQVHIGDLVSANTKINEVNAQLGELVGRVENGLHGESQVALLAAIQRLRNEAQYQSEVIMHIKSSYEAARGEIKTAREAFHELESTPLVAPDLVDFVYQYPYVLFGGVVVTGAAYLAHLYSVNAQRREQAAQRTLNSMASGLGMQRSILANPPQRHDSPPPQPSDDTDKHHNPWDPSSNSTGGGSSSSDYPGRSPLPSFPSHGRHYPTPGSPTDSLTHGYRHTHHSPESDYQSIKDQTTDRTPSYVAPPARGEGSFHQPIDDPAKISHIDPFTNPINPRMTADGRITGHLPIPFERYWDSIGTGHGSANGYQLSQAGLGALSAAGGITAIGGAGALSRRLSGSTASSTNPLFGRSGTGMSTGHGTLGRLGAGAFGTGGAGTPGAAGMGQGAAQSALGRLSVSGTTGAGVTPTAGSGAVSASGQQGSGLFGAPPGAATGSAQSDKKAGLKGYQVVRVHEEETKIIGHSDGFGAGNSESITPRRYTDNSDTWED